MKRNETCLIVTKTCEEGMKLPPLVDLLANGTFSGSLEECCLQCDAIHMRDDHTNPVAMPKFSITFRAPSDP